MKRLRLYCLPLLLLALSPLTHCLSLALPPLTAPSSPLILNVTGCSAVYPPRCFTNSALVITGTGFTAPTLNISIEGLHTSYPCPQASHPSDTEVLCRLPSVVWQDRGRLLTLRLTSYNLTSPPFTGFITYGDLSITHVKGCTNSTGGAASGCKANDTVTIYGTGFPPDTPTQALIGGVPCVKVRMVSNESMLCMLPAMDVVWSWLSFNGEFYNQWTDLNQAVMYDPSTPPTLTYINGCNTDFTSPHILRGCRTGQRITLYGTQLTAVNLTVILGGRFHCNNTRLFATNAMTCEIPDLPEEVLNRTLHMTVHCDTRVSAPYGAITSFGRLALTHATGCTGETANGTYGCRAGDGVVLHGSGLGFPGGLPSQRFAGDLNIVIGLNTGSMYWSYTVQCLNYTVLSNHRAACYLPPPAIAVQWLSVGVQAGGQIAVSVSGEMLVQYAAVPIISSVSGCWSGSAYGCHGGELLTVNGPAGSFATPIRVSIGDRYMCGSAVVLSATRVQCVMPNISWEDYGVQLPMRVTCGAGNLTSAPYLGVQSYGPMAVIGASGCARNEKNGTVAWRTSGCKAGDVVNITGMGMGGAVSVIVGSTPRSGACWPAEVLDNRTISCALDKFDAKGVWLQVLVQSGSRRAIGYGLVQYASNEENHHAQMRGDST